MARKPITKMAYKSGEEMMFGTAKTPVTTKRGIVIGGGYVHPELVAHPRPTGMPWREWSSWAIPQSRSKTSTFFR